MKKEKINTSFYFSHDTNSRSDEKIIALRIKHDWKGYGLFWAIIEKLSESNNYMCVCDYNIIAYDLRTDASTIKSIINDFGLFSFTEDGKRFYSDRLNRCMDYRNEKSVKAKVSANKRWGKTNDDTNVMQTQCERNANVMRTQCERNAKEKEIKEKEIKENFLLEKETKEKFSFRESLLDLSADEKLVDDWLLIRKNKKATNSETAFSMFFNEFKASKWPIDEVLKICIERDWKGFKTEWLKNTENNQNGNKQTVISEPKIGRRTLADIERSLSKKW